MKGATFGLKILQDQMVEFCALESYNASDKSQIILSYF